MKVEGSHFINGSTCEGDSYTVDDTSHDLAVIRIRGRYPEAGWAVNDEVHELVYVTDGSGTLEIKNGDDLSLEKGSVVSIAPRKRFAWQGELTLVMTCQPAFYPDQYSLEAR